MKLSTLLVAMGIVASASISMAANAPKVAVTIKPLHALVAGVMLGVGVPELLIKGASSPHAYAMRPSDARVLHQADLVFRMSEALEPFTIKIVQSLPSQVKVITLQDAPGLQLLPLRRGATFEARGIPGHAHEAVRTDSGAAHDVDGHIWLDPDNASAMVDSIEQALSAKAPAHAAVFKANAAALKHRLAALAAEIASALRPAADKPYIVFHDAFQYFESRFHLNVVGSISVTPEVPPSGKRLSGLRQKIESLRAMCVFGEPQVDRRLVDNLIEGTSARTGTLDAEGGSLEPGPDLYFTLLRKLADDLRSCLLAPA